MNWNGDLLTIWQKSHQSLAAIWQKWKRHLPTIQDFTTDNIGLIVALFAALFTGVGSYEAHKARVNADDAARQTISLQKQAVDAQVDTMHLDERPYVRAVPDPDELQLAKAADGTLSFTGRLKIITSGRMPAQDIDIVWDCDEELVNGPRRITQAKRSGTFEYSNNERVKLAYLTTSDEPFTTNNCPSLNITKENEGDPHILMVGEVRYLDYFLKLLHSDKWHRSRFCYLVRFPVSLQPQIKPAFQECSNFNSVL